jgi:hypothetical protein
MITKEAIEAAAKELLAHGEFGTSDGANRRNAVVAAEAALTAALAAMPGPAVKVRELVWEDDGRVSRAKAVIGIYMVRPCLATAYAGQWVLDGINDPVTLHPSPQAAKAAAQADYEARILSALTPAPDLASENERLPQDVVNLVIAAREFWDVAMDESDESAALDCALEAFSSRVPYENDPAEDRAALERT